MVAAEQAKKQIPDFRPGDTLRVHIKVVEGESERIQAFEGTCLSRRGRGEGASFTVRKVSFGVGVERTFPLFSVHLDKIEVVKSGRVRRAKLYYLRGLTGRAARLGEQESREAPKRAASAETPPAAPAAGTEKAKQPAGEAAPGAAAPAPARKEGSLGQAGNSAAAQANVITVKAGSATK